jgi:predicted PP-loop superfamily ATPase
LYEEVKDIGMIPIQHTCGRCEDIIEDIIETARQRGTSVQPTNDIVSMQKKYGHKFLFEEVSILMELISRMDATPEERIAEVQPLF